MATGGNGGQGARDAATVLPFIAAILFLPPLMLIFSSPVTIAGVPLILLYLFAAWAFVIASAFFLAARFEGIDRASDEIGRSDAAEGNALQQPPAGRRMPP